MKTILMVTVCLLVYVNANAEPCKINLTQDINYQDMNAILNCLSDKIESLEKEVRSLKRNSSVDGQQNKSNMLLENKYISVYDPKVSRDKRWVRVSLVVLNKNSDDILLAVLHGSPIIVDNKGQTFDYQIDVRGIKENSANSTDKNNYTVLNPGVPTPVSFFFDAEKFSGNEVSFRVGFLHLVNDSAKQYSVGRRFALEE